VSQRFIEDLSSAGRFSSNIPSAVGSNRKHGEGVGRRSGDGSNWVAGNEITKGRSSQTVFGDEENDSGDVCVLDRRSPDAMSSWRKNEFTR